MGDVDKKTGHSNRYRLLQISSFHMEVVEVLRNFIGKLGLYIFLLSLIYDVKQFPWLSVLLINSVSSESGWFRSG